MELHILAQHEGVGLAVLGNIPAVREVRNDRLATIARVTPDQIVEHAGLGAQIVECSGLMDIEMWLAAGERHPQHTAAFGVRFRRGKLELGAIELVRHALSQAYVRQETQGGSRHGCAALKESPPGPRGTPDRNRSMAVGHGVCLLEGLIRGPN